MNHIQKDPFQTDVHINMLFCAPTEEDYGDQYYASRNAAYTSKYNTSTKLNNPREGRGRHAQSGFDNRTRDYNKPLYFSHNKAYISCDACKMRNRIYTECRFAPKVLTVIKWATQNKPSADKMVDRHANLNSEPSKRVFVKKLIM